MTCASDKSDKDVDGDAQVVGVSGGSSCFSPSEGIKSSTSLSLVGEMKGVSKEDIPKMARNCKK